MAQSGKSQQTPKVRLAALLEAFRGLTASLEPDEVMEGICRGVDDAFGLTSVDIYEYRPESEQLVSVWSHVRDDPAAAEAFVGTAYRLDEHVPRAPISCPSKSPGAGQAWPRRVPHRRRTVRRRRPRAAGRDAAVG